MQDYRSKKIAVSLRAILLSTALMIALSVSVLVRADEVVEAQAELSPGVSQAAIAATIVAPRRTILGMGLPALTNLPTAAEGATHQLEALRERRRQRLQPFQIGIDRSVQVKTINITLGSVLAGGSSRGAEYLKLDGSEVTWSSRVRVAGAIAFRIYLEDMELPPSARIWIYNTSGEHLGPFDRGQISANGSFWLPPLEGSDIYIEIRVKLIDLEKGARLRFTLNKISEFVSLLDESVEGSEPSPDPQAWTDCEIDISCEDGTPFDIDIYATGLARLVFQDDGGGGFLCSGALVSDTVVGTFAPWLLTANHCFDSQTEADSLVAYFDYRSSTCGGSPPSLGSVPQVSGATMMASNPSSDFTFVHLDSNLSGSRWFLGWTTSTPVASQALYGLSHPEGEKAHYHNSSFNATGGIVCSSLPRPNFHYSTRITGSYTGGSSGSPAYNSTGQIVGQMYGVCYFPPLNECSSSNFNRVDGAFATTFVSISDWLDGTLPPPGSCSGDAFENDDNQGQAKNITSGVSKNHSICPVGDIDWSTFTLATESAVTLISSGPGQDDDTRMWLRDSSGSQIEYDDDSGIGRFSMITRVCDVDALPAGTYFVELDEFGGDEEIASYTLDLTVNECGSCSYSISPISESFTSSGGSSNFSVTTTAGCNWTPTKSDLWITLTSGAGSGNGTVSYTVAANTSSSSRSGTITVQDKTYTITQSGVGCSYSIAPSGESFTSTGGGGSFGVTAPEGCDWAPAKSETWITLTSGAGSGDGTVSYTVDANASSNSRSGTITVPGQTYTISQSGVDCSYSIAPSSGSFTSSSGSGSFDVTAPEGCDWTAAKSETWTTLTSGAGSGDGMVSYTVDANTSSNSRSGTITVQGQTYAITQSGVACSYSISPSSESFTSMGGGGSFAVTAPEGCGWTAVKSDTWIALTSGADSGDGTVSYTVATNTLISSRSDTILVQDKAYTVTQSGAPCNVNMVSGITENTGASHEACEILVVGPDFIAEDGASVNLSGGVEIWFMPDFLVEKGATLDVNVCGQSLCKTSSTPMPYGCHSCVNQICDIDPTCCDAGFGQACLDKVDTVCGLICE